MCHCDGDGVVRVAFTAAAAKTVDGCDFKFIASGEPTPMLGGPVECTKVGETLIVDPDLGQGGIENECARN